MTRSNSIFAADRDGIFIEITSFSVGKLQGDREAIRSRIPESKFARAQGPKPVVPRSRILKATSCRELSATFTPLIPWSVPIMLEAWISQRHAEMTRMQTNKFFNSTSSVSSRKPTYRTCLGTSVMVIRPADHSWPPEILRAQPCSRWFPDKP